MRMLDRYKLEVAINEAIGVEDDEEYSDPELSRIMRDNQSDDIELSFIFDIRDIWDLQIKRKKGKLFKILAYLESGVTIDVKASEFDEMLEIWRKRTYKRG